MSVAAIGAAADSLIAQLGDTVPAYTDSLVQLRHRYLRTQLGALSARAAMLGGRRFTFDEEAKALYDVTPPTLSDAHFDSLVSRLDALIPGPGSLASRYQRFRDGAMIPAARVDTVFKVAIAACRARTLAQLPLPASERFDLEYVKGTSWNAYNWYKGEYHSLIQVNLDFPIPVDRAVPVQVRHQAGQELALAQVTDVQREAALGHQRVEAVGLVQRGLHGGQCQICLLYTSPSPRD